MPTLWKGVQYLWFLQKCMYSMPGQTAVLIRVEANKNGSQYIAWLEDLAASLHKRALNVSALPQTLTLWEIEMGYRHKLPGVCLWVLTWHSIFWHHTWKTDCPKHSKSTRSFWFLYVFLSPICVSLSISFLHYHIFSCWIFYTKVTENEGALCP